MQLELTYQQIWRISAPIMLGSAAQNVIALSDAVLLYHLGEVEFAAIGFVGVFYITVAAIGYGFSRGGQIMIARRMGERRPFAVGYTFHAMLLFELALATLMWCFMRFASGWFFQLFLADAPEIYQKSLDYIHYRSYGVFFSYAGVALISLYSGIARPTIILLDTIILALVNLTLNYGLIFGKFGLPAMGIGGSGLASSIAEGIAFVFFALYIVWDKKNRPLHLFRLHRDPEIEAPQAQAAVPGQEADEAELVFHPNESIWQVMRHQLRISLPVVAQAAVSQGSWVFFFGMVAHLGQHALAVSNLARTVYLLLSIPLWGFSAGVNTLVSNLIGQKRQQEVMQAAWKTGKLCWIVTFLFAAPILFFPEFFLYPLLGKSDMSLIAQTRPVFYILLIILSMSAFGSVLNNTLAGTGATWYGFQLQLFTISIYIGYIYLATSVFHFSLPGIWAAEVWYWLATIALAVWYLRSDRWHKVHF
ncbi:MAG: MATE family efflux transporter [Bacteroidetes bacterium]|nr:MATE family efflux transporter [Bacteroidota bacterium]